MNNDLDYIRLQLMRLKKNLSEDACNHQIRGDELHAAYCRGASNAYSDAFEMLKVGREPLPTLREEAHEERPDPTTELTPRGAIYGIISDCAKL